MAEGTSVSEALDGEVVDEDYPSTTEESEPLLPARPQKRGRGKPSKLTAEVMQSICRLLKSANYFETACSMSGVSPVTGRQWLREGARDRDAGKRSAIARFAEEVEKANAFGEASLVLQIRNHGKTDYKAAAFVLGRRFRSRWGDVADINVKVEDVTQTRLLVLQKLLLAKDTDADGGEE